MLNDLLFNPCTKFVCVFPHPSPHIILMVNMASMFLCWLSPGGAGGKGVWGAAGMVYEDEEPDMRDPNYDEVAQVSEYSRLFIICIYL